MGLLMLLTALVVLIVAVQGSISISRTFNELENIDLKLDIDGCTKTDQYGCAQFSTDFGKKISGHVKAALKEDLGEGSHFVATLHIKTGILPIPFTVQCPLCGGKCDVKIPVLEKDVSIKLPPCPLKASSRDQGFSATIPSNDPIPLTIGVDGIINVFDANNKEIVSAHINAKVSKGDDVSSSLLRGSSSLNDFTAYLDMVSNAGELEL